MARPKKGELHPEAIEINTYAIAEGAYYEKTADSWIQDFECWKKQYGPDAKFEIEPYNDYGDDSARLIVHYKRMEKWGETTKRLKAEAQQEKWNRQKEERERKEYERLKKKYGP